MALMKAVKKKKRKATHTQIVIRRNPKNGFFTIRKERVAGKQILESKIEPGWGDLSPLQAIRELWLYIRDKSGFGDTAGLDPEIRSRINRVDSVL